MELAKALSGQNKETTERASGTASKPSIPQNGYDSFSSDKVAVSLFEHQRPSVKTENLEAKKTQSTLDSNTSLIDSIDDANFGSDFLTLPDQAEMHSKQRTKTYGGTKLFVCEVCGKEFSRKFSLKEHATIHSGERPYKCGVCGKDFSLKLRLKQHMINHSTESPYKCEICDKKFLRNNDLQRHLLIHTGVRSYKCEICDKAFTLPETSSILTSGTYPHRR
ncbi:zinc finger protein 816-like isoform X3 [Topomyia yanbarensis]|uniref:zinc finger protein 816-like isoform X3 n=1 Tax=Topomyia yanbarensis TaxID=2498891 RepID=UPI00273A82D7|nr:zinc finger protein 816-like isoform X3 [Topomyia yanbarensis]